MPGLFKKAPASTSSKKKSDSPIFVAADVTDSKGAVLVSKEQVVEAINGFATGKELENQGLALQETHRPTLGLFGRSRFAELWASDGVLPRSPKLTTKPDGTGTQVTMSFVDRPKLLSDEAFKGICDCIGEKNAEEAVERFTTYSIDATLAAKKVKVEGKELTFQEHIEEALVKYFPEEYHEAISAMLKPKNVFQTKKGCITRLLDWCGRSTPNVKNKLAEALVKVPIITSFKPGTVGDDD